MTKVFISHGYPYISTIYVYDQPECQYHKHAISKTNLVIELKPGKYWTKISKKSGDFSKAVEFEVKKDMDSLTIVIPQD